MIFFISDILKSDTNKYLPNLRKIPEKEHCKIEIYPVYQIVRIKTDKFLTERFISERALERRVVSFFPAASRRRVGRHCSHHHKGNGIIEQHFIYLGFYIFLFF